MIADEVFRRGRAGLPSWINEHDGSRSVLPVSRWMGGTAATADDLRADAASIALCSGPTLDLGCGPGRLTEALLKVGVPALGVDASPVAVEITNERGGVAVVRDIFSALPGTGYWSHVLLADGNIGIGGDPTVLLRQACSLLRLGGTVIVEAEKTVAAGVYRRSVRWETTEAVGEWFAWASVGMGAVYELASSVGLDVRRIIEVDERVFMELTMQGIQ
ncbi:class I SAM-dependent methyltransferase [Rhodococcus sovatensis]|uniref:Class I SAM-dependent methyltransferase n=1 Tax=Rhodococcus sovatensis TaxID=1805840 RepID=A0ABZ2PIY8_9NOCA